MAEKMAERIAEILKEPNFQTAEKALTDFCGPMDGEFRNLLVDIIVERWIDTPKDVPFSYARSIWNRKDINREEYQALLEEIRSYLEKKENPVTEIPLYEMLREHREESLYYRTDHHWTTLGARYAYQSAAGQMGLPGAENGEEKKLYPVSDSFQGTLAARSGYRVPDDTIEVYWPDQEEELVVTYVQEQTKSASLYAAEKLKTRDKYGMFLNGNHPLTEIRTMASTGRKLLLIKDSYANCFVPFLTGDFEEIVLVDPRYYYDSAEKLMKQYGFTDVLFLYNLNTFLEDDVLHYVLE